MALIALVYSKSPGSVMAMANLIFFIAIPVFVVGPVAGVCADRWDRKRIMVASDLIRGVLVLMIPVFIFLDIMIPVYVLVFLIFSGTRFFLPSKMALIPDIVPKERLLLANSLTNTTRMIAAMMGFAIAGVLVQRLGYMWGFYINGMSYFISAVLISLITPKRKTVDIKEDIHMTREVIECAIRKNIFKEVAEGYKIMFRSPGMKTVTSGLFLTMAGAGSVFCVILVFIQESFGTGTETLGVLGVFMGAGLFLGTIVHGRACQRMSKTKAMFGGIALCGVFLSAFAVIGSEGGSFYPGAAMLFLTGVSAAPIFTSANYLIHVSVPDGTRGRIFSAMELVVHTSFLVFTAIAALLSLRITNFNLIFYGGLIFAMAGAAGNIIYGQRKSL